MITVVLKFDLLHEEPRCAQGLGASPMHSPLNPALQSSPKSLQLLIRLFVTMTSYTKTQ